MLECYNIIKIMSFIDFSKEYCGEKNKVSEIYTSITVHDNNL